MAEIRFYLDENLPLQIGIQLSARGIDVITVRDQALLGDSDLNHLHRATEQNRVLCTHDTDFLHLAASGIQHSGIIFGRQNRHHIGDWVNGLTLVHAIYTTEEMVNMVEFL